VAWVEATEGGVMEAMADTEATEWAAMEDTVEDMADTEAVMALVTRT